MMKGHDGFRNRGRWWGAVLVAVLACMWAPHPALGQAKDDSVEPMATNDPGYQDAEARNLIKKGAMAIDAGNIAEAREFLSRAVKKVPNSAMAHVHLGRALYAAGEYEEAEKQVRKAIELNPDDASGHFTLGVLYTRKGEWEKAIEQYDAALAANPGHIPAAVNKGQAEFQLGRVDDAIKSSFSCHPFPKR